MTDLTIDVGGCAADMFTVLLAFIKLTMRAVNYGQKHPPISLGLAQYKASWCCLWVASAVQCLIEDT